MKDESALAGGDRKEMTLEECFGRLDGILEKLQDPGLPLEEAFASYDEGMKILKECSGRIDLVEKKVRILNGDELPEEPAAE